MYISYGQLGAVHQAAGELEIAARRRGEKLHAGLFVGSVKSTDLQRANEGDDIIVTFTRYEAPPVIRRYSYFGQPVRLDARDPFTVVAETTVEA